VIAACSCAATGDSEGLSRLFNLGISLNNGDYDKRTPLHLASAAGHYDIVKYLIELKKYDPSTKQMVNEINIHVVDRWGATPLNDAKTEEIKELLLSHGAQKGVEHAPYEELPSANVTEDNYRLFYAAFTGDVHLMKSL